MRARRLFTWRRLVVEGALTDAGSGEHVVPASDYRALQSKLCELQRLLGKKSLEAEILAEILKEALEQRHRVKKTAVAGAVAAEGRFAMKRRASHIGCPKK